MGKQTINIGDIFTSNNSGQFKVIDYKSWDNIKIEFINTGTIKIVNSSNINKGTIKDNLFPTVFNVGYIGYGEYEPKLNGKELPEYIAWRSMIKRCYSDKSLIDSPTYNEVEVCEEWKNYQIFAKWWNNQYKEKGWNLDKDLLSKNTKIYSPETSCYLPKELNMVLISENNKKSNLPTGVFIKRDKYGSQLTKYGKSCKFKICDTPEEAHIIYLQEKQKYIIELANLYKEKLSDKVYNALLNFTN